MAIYRAEQARLSFASEAGRSGYMENATADDHASADPNNASIAAMAPAIGYPAGTRIIEITLPMSGGNAIAIPDPDPIANPNPLKTVFPDRRYIRIGAATDSNSEIRKILRTDGTTIFLDYPTGFPHLNGIVITLLKIHTDVTDGLEGRNFMTFFPGVYETINTPDLTPEFTPHYIVSNRNDRNFSIMYRGKQSYQGSLPNFIMLNGYPLKYVLGEATTFGTYDGSTIATPTTTLIGTTSVGEQTITIGATTSTISIGEYIQIEDSNTSPSDSNATKPEVRQVAEITNDAVASIGVDVGGSGYTSEPMVTFSGGGGSGAMATAEVTGIGSIGIDNGGSGYTAIPTVTITGGGGSGATATATLASGVVDGITVNDAGSGYATAPTVTIADPPSGGTTAMATAEVTGIGNIIVDNGGSGYTAIPTVTIADPPSSGTTATATVLTLEGKLRLNYPLMLVHPSDSSIRNTTTGTGSRIHKVIAPFTHNIAERTTLPTMTWNVLMVDSAENKENNFLRRFIGGIVNRATLSADEGGMLMMAWDDVQFQDLIHNQPYHNSVGNGSTEIIKSSQALLLPWSKAGEEEQGSIYGDIGGDIRYNNGAETKPIYPATDPYYFSEGFVRFYGQQFARIRNFRIDMNNNIEARYYIREQSESRGPTEFLEQRREYTMTASVAMEDTSPNTSTSRSLWKELILEGHYGGDIRLAGWEMSLEFRRRGDDDDKMTIRIPGHNTDLTNDRTNDTDSDAQARLNEQGIFVTRAPHNIGTESPIQIDLELKFRGLNMVVKDSVAVYP